MLIVIIWNLKTYIILKNNKKVIIIGDTEIYIINNDKYVVETKFGNEELENIIADIISKQDLYSWQTSIIVLQLENDCNTIFLFRRLEYDL